jgi:group I intron endonuclease
MGNAMKECGIYEIRNIVNNKRYVGSSSDMRRRFNQHRSSLRRSCHYNIKLQNSWNKHGESAFQFTRLAILESYEQVPTEQRLLTSIKDSGEECYNLTFEVELIGAWNKGKKSSEETKQKLRDNMNKPGVKEALLKHLIGRPVSKETREKMAIAKKGKKHSLEHIEKAAAKRKGTHWLYCRNGHEKSGDNLIIISGAWQCKICLRATKQRHKDKQKQQKILNKD